MKDLIGGFAILGLVAVVSLSIACSSTQNKP